MSWTNIDDRILSHPKMKKAVKAKGDAAWSMWSRGLVYTNAYDLDGLVPRDVVDELTSDRKPFDVADVLVSVGLWEKLESGDYRIHDFADYNDSRAEREARRQVNRERVKKSRDKRAGIACEIVSPPQRADAGNAPVMHYSQNHALDVKRVSADPIPSQATPSQAKPSREVQHTPDGGTSTYIPPAPPETTTNPDAAKILDRLRAHPELAPVASVGVAERLAGFRMAGKTLDAILLSVDELADKATAAVIANAPWNTEHMAAKAIAFGRNASPPRPQPPKPGQAMTPDQVLAEQRRRGVQQGTGGPPRAVRREGVPDER